MRQIRSEIQTVGKIRHRNLLPLLAHLSRPTCHYLVYEFMNNGSLQDLIQQVNAGTRELDWPARHRIAIGVASGLEYLHINHTPRIVHRDLKPANVLLDDDMEARIADFGLAKSIPEAQTHMTSSNVAGTLGYIAPEYHQTMKFTDKCDIYSFGVLLGVLVIGKLPSDEFFQNTSEVNLVKWMRRVMTSDNPSEAIDPRLLGNGYEEQMMLVLKIACFCTLDNPKERPNSKDCRVMLAQIDIHRDRTKRLIGLSQSTYLDKVLKRFNMTNSGKGFLPMANGTRLSKEQSPSNDIELERMNRIPYASAIGSIMYAMTCTRPDVSFALSMVSRYQGNPGEAHWVAVKNILKYLRRTKDMLLVYGGVNELKVTGYTDASFQTDRDDSRSQSGWVFLLNGGAITWKSSKQDTVADSTCESEYIAASEATKEAIWLRYFISDLGVVPSISERVEIFCDNTGAVALTKEPKDHGKSKHIDRKYHFVRSKVEEGHVMVDRVSSEENPADPFTKALSRPKFELHTEPSR